VFPLLIYCRSCLIQITVFVLSLMHTTGPLFLMKSLSLILLMTTRGKLTEILERKVKPRLGAYLLLEYLRARIFIHIKHAAVCPSKVRLSMVHIHAHELFCSEAYAEWGQHQTMLKVKSSLQHHLANLFWNIISYLRILRQVSNRCLMLIVSRTHWALDSGHCCRNCFISFQAARVYNCISCCINHVSMV